MPFADNFKSKEVKPRKLDNTLRYQGRHADTKSPLELISLNGPSKVTTAANFKISKPKKEAVKPRKLENTPYQKSLPPEPKSAIFMSRPSSPDCGTLPDCWGCGAELCEFPPCSCEECGMPH